MSDSFEKYFQKIYQNQWQDLQKALLDEPVQMIRNCFGASDFPSNDFILNFPRYFSDRDYEIVQSRNTQNLRQYYVMDPASYICAQQLPIDTDDFVLDMCAAPGGKTLVLLEKEKFGELWANEISQNRRFKLKQTIQDYVPSSLRAKTYIKGKDGIQYGMKYPKSFDKILIDAPCSSERHLLHNPALLKQWSEKRTKRLAARQYGLLCSALLALKPGGTLLYSTCSISPLENDLVIEKFLAKKGDDVEIDETLSEVDSFQRTLYGFQALPHLNQIGPIYLARLRKKI